MRRLDRPGGSCRPRGHPRGGGGRRGAPPSYYDFTWRVDDCRYGVRHSDGPGEYRENGLVFAVPPTTQFTVTCGERVERPCELIELGTHCYDHPPSTIILLEEGSFRTVGNTLTWTLDFDGDLAPYAAARAPGQRLLHLHAMAAGPIGAGVSYCVGGLCGGVVSDFAYGAEHVIGS